VASPADFVIGLIIAAYWMRVVRMVIKARRRGRDAHFVPRESVGRRLRIIWYPVVALWVIHPFVNAFDAKPQALLRPILQNQIVIWLAAAVAACAFTLTYICWRRMGRSWRMGIDPADQTALITTGLYAYVRHPIYALSSLMMLATLAAIPSPLMAVIAVIHLVFLQWEARREERHLLAAHGENYADYCRKTGRFLPRVF
jgi:protein-S-isoprenylcysteine O-methyltransferase Ste14